MDHASFFSEATLFQIGVFTLNTEDVQGGILNSRLAKRSQ